MIREGGGGNPPPPSTLPHKKEKRRGKKKGNRQYTEEAKRFIYRMFSDPVFIFKEHFVRDDTSTIQKHELYTMFLNECTKHEFPAQLGEYDFYKAIQGAAPWVVEYRPDGGVRTFKGLKYDPSKCGPLFELCVKYLANLANFGRISLSTPSPSPTHISSSPSPNA